MNISQQHSHRRRSTRRVAALAAVAGLALVTTACSGTDDDATVYLIDSVLMPPA